MSKSVNKQEWENAAKELIARRLANPGTKPGNSILSDYKSHLEKCGYGDSVFDVGCGDQYLKTCLPPHVYYQGLDPFPVEGTDTIEGSIEDIASVFESADTLCAMAVLDNCQDFDEAIDSMKFIAKRNIIILTGIGIEPDQYHTMKLELSDFDEAFKGWDNTVREELSPKVWLLNYNNPNFKP
jgi:hypothetical protein